MDERIEGEEREGVRGGGLTGKSEADDAMGHHFMYVCVRVCVCVCVCPFFWDDPFLLSSSGSKEP